MGNRVKGQEVEIILLKDGSPLDTITTIKNFEFNFELEILKEGYMGETTDRRDTIYRGVSGKFDLHMESDAVLRLAVDVVAKARARVPGMTINLKATLNFANGDRPRIIIPDIAFGQFPFSFGGRAEYVQGTVNYEAAESRVIF